MILKKKYPALSFAENFLGGHVNIGPVTIFGENAMHWGVTVKTRRWGYVCFRLPFRCFGQWWPLYLYCSPNGTPAYSTFAIGKHIDKPTKLTAPIRRYLFGHNFSPGDDFGKWNRQIRDNLEHLHFLNSETRSSK